MSYAVYHLEKGNISSGGIGNHIDRTEGKEHSFRHADPSRKHLNQNIIVNDHCSKPLHEGISNRIKQGYKAKNKAGELKLIRKDAVKYTTHILTGSHEQMQNIENNETNRKAWILANLDFIKQEYGKDNIVRFCVHRDEKTMHIHVVTVPLTSDGRLSAKDVLGGRKEMSERQDRYAGQMERFGLQRGLKYTGIKHEDAKEYYKRIGKNSAELSHKPIKKTLLGIEIGIYKDKTIEGLKTALKDEVIKNNETNDLVLKYKADNQTISKTNSYLSKDRDKYKKITDAEVIQLSEERIRQSQNLLSQRFRDEMAKKIKDLSDQYTSEANSKEFIEKIKICQDLIQYNFENKIESSTKDIYKIFFGKKGYSKKEELDIRSHLHDYLKSIGGFKSELTQRKNQGLSR